MSTDETLPTNALEPEPATRPLPAPPLPVAAPAPTGATAVAPLGGEAPRGRGPRMRTVVLGLVLAAVSGTSLVQLLTDARVDDGAVALTVLIVAGLLLLGGGALAGARDARRHHRGDG